MLTFATPEDLARWPGGADLDDPEGLLAAASARVANLTVTAFYTTGADGLPEDTDLRAALRDATCAQAVFFDEIGGTSGAEQQFQTLSLGSARFTRAGAGATARARTPERDSPAAIDILRAAGLLSGAVLS